MEEQNPSTELNPERLLDSINRSIFVRAFLMSLVVHLVIVFASSFGLYKDWSVYGIQSEDYGFHIPSVIKTIKRDVAAANEEAQRQKHLEERIAEQTAEADQSSTPEPVEETESTSQPETPTPPEIEPMAPKENFSLDDMPGLSL